MPGRTGGLGLENLTVWAWTCSCSVTIDSVFCCTSCTIIDFMRIVIILVALANPAFSSLSSLQRQSPSILHLKYPSDAPGGIYLYRV
jgi:hypothetical protein